MPAGTGTVGTVAAAGTVDAEVGVCSVSGGVGGYGCGVAVWWPPSAVVEKQVTLMLADYGASHVW